MGAFDEWMSKFEDGAKPKAASAAEQPMTPLAASFRPLSPQGQKVREDFVRDRSVGLALATDMSSAFGGDLPARAKEFEPFANKAASKEGIGRPTYPGAATLKAAQGRPFVEDDSSWERAAQSAEEKFAPAHTFLSDPSTRSGKVTALAPPTGVDDDESGRSDESAAQLRDDWRRENLARPNSFGTLGSPTTTERVALDVVGLPFTAGLGFADELSSRITGNPKWIPDRGFDSVGVGLGEAAANVDKGVAAIGQNLYDRGAEAVDAVKASANEPLDPVLAKAAEDAGVDPELFKIALRVVNPTKAGLAAFLRTTPERLGFGPGSDKSWSESVAEAGSNILPELGRMVQGIVQLAGEGIELGQRDQKAEDRWGRAANVITQIPAEIGASLSRTALNPQRTIEEEPVSTLLNAIWMTPAWKRAAKPGTDAIRNKGGGSPEAAQSAARAAFDQAAPLVDEASKIEGGLQAAKKRTEFAEILDAEARAALDAPPGKAHQAAAEQRQSLERQIADLDDTIQRAQMSREPIATLLDEGPIATGREVVAAADSVSGQRAAIAAELEAARAAEAAATAKMSEARQALVDHELARPITPEEFIALRRENWTATKSKAKRADRASRNQAIKDRFAKVSAWSRQGTELRKAAKVAGKEAVAARTAAQAAKVQATEKLKQLIGVEDVAKARRGAVDEAMFAQAGVAPTRPATPKNTAAPTLVSLYEQRKALYEQLKAAKETERAARSGVEVASAQAFPVYESLLEHRLAGAMADDLRAKANSDRLAASKADQAWTAQKQSVIDEAKRAREEVNALEAATPSMTKTPPPASAPRPVSAQAESQAARAARQVAEDDAVLFEQAAVDRARERLDAAVNADRAAAGAPAPVPVAAPAAAPPAAPVVVDKARVAELEMQLKEVKKELKAAIKQAGARADSSENVMQRQMDVGRALRMLEDAKAGIAEAPWYVAPERTVSSIMLDVKRAELRLEALLEAEAKGFVNHFDGPDYLAKRRAKIAALQKAIPELIEEAQQMHRAEGRVVRAQEDLRETLRLTDKRIAALLDDEARGVPDPFAGQPNKSRANDIAINRAVREEIAQKLGEPAAASTPSPSLPADNAAAAAAKVERAAAERALADAEAALLQARSDFQASPAAQAPGTPAPPVSRQAQVAAEVGAELGPKLGEMRAANKLEFTPKPDAQVVADFNKLVAAETTRRLKLDYRTDVVEAASVVGKLEAQVAQLRATAAGKAPDPYASVIKIADDSAEQSAAMSALPAMEQALDAARAQLLDANSSVFGQVYQHFPDELQSRLVMDRSAVEVAEVSAKALVAERNGMKSSNPAFDAVDSAVRLAAEKLRAARATYKSTLSDARAYRAQFDSQVAAARARAQQAERRVTAERSLFERRNAKTLRRADDAERRAAAARKAQDNVTIPLAREVKRLDDAQVRFDAWRRSEGDFTGGGASMFDAAINHARKTEAAVRRSARFEALARQVEKLPVTVATLGTSLLVDALGAAFGRALKAPGRGSKRWWAYAQNNRVPPELLTEMRRLSGEGHSVMARLEDAYAAMPASARPAGRQWLHGEHVLDEGSWFDTGNVRAGAPGSKAWAAWSDKTKQWGITPVGQEKVNALSAAIDANLTLLDDLKSRAGNPAVDARIADINLAMKADAKVLQRFQAEMTLNNRYAAPLAQESRALSQQATELGLIGEDGGRALYWPSVFPKKRGFKDIGDKQWADLMKAKATDFIDGAAPTPSRGGPGTPSRSEFQAMGTPDRSIVMQNTMRAQRIPMSRRELQFGQSRRLSDEVAQLGALNASVQLRKLQGYAAQRYAKTLEQIDIEAKTRAAIDQTGEIASKSTYKRYKEVPTDTLPNGQPRYGDMAGKFIPEEIYYELANAQALIEQAQGFLPTMIRAMKIGKTVFSPSTHARNILTNVFILAPMAGMSLLNPLNWPYYLEAVRNHLSNTKSPAYEQLRAAGQGAGGIVTSELMPSLSERPSLLGTDITEFAKGFQDSLRAGGTGPVRYFLELAYRPAESLVSGAKGIKDAAGEIGALRRNEANMPAVQTNREWLESLGQREPTPRMDEMNIAKVGDIPLEVGASMKRAFMSPVDALARVYNFSDQVFRDALALKRLDEGRMADAAVAEGLNAYVNYAGVPGWVNLVRSPFQMIGAAGVPLASTMGVYMLASAPFMAFTAAAVPLFGRWMKRNPLEAQVWLTLSDYVSDLNYAEAGIDPEAAKRAMAQLPARQQNKFVLMASIAPSQAFDERGRLTLIDTSFGNPAGSVFPSWDKYTNTSTNVLNAVKEVAGVGEIPFGIAPAFGALTGYDSARGRVFTDPLSTTMEDIATRMSYLAQTALPGWTPGLTDYLDWELGGDGGTTNAERWKGGYDFESAAKADEGAMDEYGNVVSGQTNDLKQAGIRTAPFDQVELTRYHLNKLRGAFQAANDSASSSMRDPRRYSDYADPMDGDINLADEHAKRTVWRLRPTLVMLRATLADLDVPDDLEDARYQLDEVVEAIESLKSPDDLPIEEWGRLRGLVNKIQGAAFQSAGSQRKQLRLGNTPVTPLR